MLSFQPLLFDARVQKEARALHEAGWDVTILYVEDPRSLESLDDLSARWQTFREANRGIHRRAIYLRSREWRNLPGPVRKAAQAAELCLKMAWAVVRTPASVYHCHDLEPGAFAWLGRIVHRGQLVYDAHELEVRGPGRLLSFLQRVYERFVVRASNLVITVNPEIAELMSRSYVRSVLTIANRPEYVSAGDISANRLHARAGISHGARTVMYVGFLARETRGIEQVVEALALLPDDVVFLIMGTGRISEFKAYLREYARSRGVDRKRVVFVPPCAPDEVVELLAGADISVALYQAQLSANNALNAPNKLFQSIMARTPLLVADNATLPELVLRNPIGPVGAAVDPRDPAAIAAQIALLLEPQRQASLKSNAEGLAQEVSWEGEREKLLRAYRVLSEQVARR